MDAAETATRYILENEIRIFGANSTQAVRTRSNLAVIAGERAAKPAPHPTDARADRIAAIVKQVLSGAISEFRSGLNLDQLPDVAGTESSRARRGQPLTYDFDVVTDLFGSGLGAELVVFAITAGASIKEDPFDPKSSNISFDSFWVKFRMNR